jgi:pimeloyl-ACP methyl ester carboxylesterase
MTAQLHQHRFGAGEPVVLIHGLGATWRCWMPVIDALAAHHEVFAFDLPGFGRSRALEDEVAPTVVNLADALARQLDELGLERAHLVGNSMGGWIALELARRGRALSVVALSPLGLGTDRENRWSDRRLRLAYIGARMVRPVAGPLARTAVGRTMLNGFQTARPWRVDPAETAHTVREFVSATGWPETLEVNVRSRAEELEDIRCPVTIAWGTRDRVLPYRQAGRFAEAIPQARTRVLRGLGHVPMSDDPDLVAGVILQTTT